MKTQTRTAQTIHGDVDYKTVECTSCGNEVRKENAYQYIAGDVDERRHWSHKNTYEYELYDKSVIEGSICEYCKEEGPVGYPQNESSSDWVNQIILAVGMGLSFLLGAGVEVFLL